MNTANSKEFTDREKLVCKVYPSKAHLIIGTDEVEFEITDEDVRFYNLSELSALRLFRHYTVSGLHAQMFDFTTGNYTVWVSLK